MGLVCQRDGVPGFGGPRSCRNKFSCLMSCCDAMLKARARGRSWETCLNAKMPRKSPQSSQSLLVLRNHAPCSTSRAPVTSPKRSSELPPTQPACTLSRRVEFGNLQLAPGSQYQGQSGPTRTRSTSPHIHGTIAKSKNTIGPTDSEFRLTMIPGSRPTGNWFICGGGSVSLILDHVEV